MFQMVYEMRVDAAHNIDVRPRVGMIKLGCKHDSARQSRRTEDHKATNGTILCTAMGPTAEQS